MSLLVMLPCINFSASQVDECIWMYPLICLLHKNNQLFFQGYLNIESSKNGEREDEEEQEEKGEVRGRNKVREEGREKGAKEERSHKIWLLYLL